MKTLTIFRKFKSGEVIALFPLVPSSSNGFYCQSYQHIGQHGGASPNLVHDTKLAAKKEFAPLAKELRQIGYKLQIGKRFPRNSLAKRREACE